jgi:hypothetical protein
MYGLVKTTGCHEKKSKWLLYALYAHLAFIFCILIFVDIGRKVRENLGEGRSNSN